MTRPVSARTPAPGWVFAVVAVLLAGGAVAVGVNTERTIVRVADERHGTITVSGCVYSHSGAHGKIYHCDGDFTADDGTFRTHGVEFHNTRRLASGDAIEGIVSGPRDHTADTESRWEIGVKSAFTLALAAAVAGTLVLWRRVRRLRRAGVT